MLQGIKQAFAPGGIPRLGKALALQQVCCLQALSQDQPGLWIVARAAAVQLLEGGLRVTSRQPVHRFKARSFQLVAQLLYELGLIAFTGQFP
ncbi:hypothetical protein D3C76_979280 [compost metagenome]